MTDLGHREPLIPKHGGYRKLVGFRIAQLVYDLTVRFCERYVERMSRTRDQMVQAARSGVQNIAEGSQASGTSRKTELKLTSVARASLEELRLDYEDFLRQHGLKLWPRDDPRRADLVARRCATADEVAAWVREKAREERTGKDGQYGLYGRYGRDGQKENPSKPGLPLSPRLPMPPLSPMPPRPPRPPMPPLSPRPPRLPMPPLSPGPSLSPRPSGASIKSIPSISSIPSMKSPPPIVSAYPGLSANAALVLIGVAVALLDRQIGSLARSFESEGGFTERLYRTRLRTRGRE